MKAGGIFLALGLCALAGCSKGAAKEPATDEVVEAPSGDELMEYGEEQIEADDPRNRMRSALKQIGQEDQIPEDATQEELEALIEQKVESGLIPKEHAEKVLKVLETADQRNQRLENLDQQLFGENAH